MPNVPRVPGVPSLSSYTPNTTALAVADILTAVSALFPVTWGIFANGQPVITPANIITQSLPVTLGTLSAVASFLGVPNVVPVSGSTVEFEFAGDTPISSYPQEEGAFQSYDKVIMPYDIRLKIACGGSNAQRQGFFSTLEALRTTTSLVDVVTPEGTFRDVNCKHVDYTRRSDRGVDLIVANVSFEQVRFETSSAYTNTAKASDSAAKSLGNVQAQGVPDSVRQQFALGVQ